MKNIRLFNWRFPWRSLISQEAGATLFQGLRVRLTLWYCAVMAVALVLFGIALYLSTSYFLLNQTQDAVARNAKIHAQQWQNNLQVDACQALPGRAPVGGPPSPGGQPFVTMKIVCFDTQGTLLITDNAATLQQALLTNALALKALQTGQPQSESIDAGDPDGQTYRYALPVPNPVGKGYLGVIVVSESIQAQNNLLALLLEMLLSIGGFALLGASIGGLFLARRALQPARLAWSNQQRFIADASHELRTPLTLLRADAEVLLRNKTQLAADDILLLEDIVQETSHMSHIATSLLTLARLDSRNVHRELDVVDIIAIARQAVQRVQALADQQRLKLQLETDGPAVVVGDPALLEQALIALLDNAIKYNRPGGSITLQTRTNKGQMQLSIQDTGIGIAAEHLPHLGERFYRVDKARSREAGGTGLGLSIVHGIAQSHSGSLSIQSVAGQGTTVTLQLPLAHAVHAASAIPEAPMVTH